MCVDRVRHHTQQINLRPVLKKRIRGAESLSRQNDLARGALQSAWSPMAKDARDHHVTEPRFDRGVDDQQISPVQGSPRFQCNK